jgi:hypothetical protein
MLQSGPSTPLVCFCKLMVECTFIYCEYFNYYQFEKFEEQVKLVSVHFLLLVNLKRQSSVVDHENKNVVVLI